MTQFATNKSARKPVTASTTGAARSQLASVSSRNVIPSDVNARLARYVPYIQSLLRKKASPEGEEDIKDITQEVLLALWLNMMPRQGEINSPIGYVHSAVHSHWVDAVRKCQRQPTLPLLEENGEYSQEVVRNFPGEALGDPAHEYERKELLEEVISEATQLPPIQMKATICMLRDEVGNIFPLAEEFAKYRIDISSTFWPDDEHERQSWLSSLSVARKKLRTVLKKRGVLA